MPHVEVELRAVTLENRGDLEAIDPGPAARGWVHAPWYWHQASLERAGVEFRLAFVVDSPRAVGMVAYGPACQDRELTQHVTGRYELTHLVIDHRWHRRGIGRAVACQVFSALALHPDCQEIVIAHHPGNRPSRELFSRMGLRPSAERNYDGDPLLIADSVDLSKLTAEA